MITQADVYDAVPGFVSRVMFYVRGTFTGWFLCVFAEGFVGPSFLKSLRLKLA